MRLGVIQRDCEGLFAGRRSLIHGIVENLLANGTQSTRTKFILDGSIHYKLFDTIFHDKFHSVEFKKFLILLENRILRLGQDTEKRIPVQTIQISHDRKTSDNLRNKTISLQILSRNIFQKIILVYLLLLGSTETNYLGVKSLSYTALDTLERTATDVCGLPAEGH